MQILSQAPALPFVAIRFIEGGINKFIEKNGVEELHIGYGKGKGLSRRKMILFLRKIVSTAKQQRLPSISIDWSELQSLAESEIDRAWIAATAATSFEMANFEFTAYKTPPSEGFFEVQKVYLSNFPSELRLLAKKLTKLVRSLTLRVAI
jgi:leucyl aminopeptidase